MPDQPLITLARPLPGIFDVQGSTIRVGPERGFASSSELHDFVRGAHACVTWVSERVDDAFLDAAGPQLKVVSNFAVGYDNIDVDACRKRGVIVTNTPDAVTEGTADMAWALLLGAARRIGEADRFVRSGAWAEHGILGPAEFIGRDIAGRTLLIVGAGRIGYATALRSIGWGMRVLYVARSRKPAFEFAPLNGMRVDLEAGLAQADFVSVHVPLTEDTRHLINADRIALMRPTAVIVSTARGPVIDEAALTAALQARRIAAAGLDVFENEPRIHPGLAELDNVLMTPHCGSAAVRSRAMMTELCEANIRAVFNGQPPVTPVT